MDLTSRQIITFLMIGLMAAFGASLMISKQLSKAVSVESRNRDLNVLFGAIEAGPLAIAKLQSSAIAQEQLNLLMANPELKERGFLSARIAGGPSSTFTYANWESSTKAAGACPSPFERIYQYPDALNPFRVTVVRDECFVVAEQNQIFKISSLAALMVALVTLVLIAASVWPVADSVRKAERAFINNFAEAGKITFRPIRRLMRDAIRKSELEREQALTTLAQQVSHDIRSPLGALRMAVSVSRELPQEKAELITNAIQRISDISDRLLSETRRVRKSASTSASAAVNQIIAEKKIEMMKKPGIKIKADCQGDVKIPMEPGSFLQILSNLINNSVEAMETEGTITVGVRHGQNGADVIVSDTGKGIPEHVLSNLADRSLSFGKANGTGLGLSHARATVESAGGKLSIQSKVGIGTIVRMSFPNLL